MVKSFGNEALLLWKMRSVTTDFYHEKMWKVCRAAYLKEHPLCENCLEYGIYTPAKHVHHIIELNDVNKNIPEIAYGFDNLKALCIPCHNQVDTESIPRRYEVGPDGSIIIR